MALGGCADGGPDDGRPVVVATTTHVAELVRGVAGDGVRVVALVPAGSDPHSYEPRPDDVREIPEAKVVFRAGGEVDEWLADTLEAAGGEAKVVDLGERVDADPQDPHWWQDPEHGRSAVKAIAGELLEVGGTGDVRGRAEAFDRRLRDLDSGIEACMNKLEPAERKLVTTHDSLGYFARRYGLTVLGSVIPSRSTQGQPSVGETARLVEALRRERVKAIFTEHAVPARVERAIAEEAGVRVGGALWTDSLDAGVSYERSLSENAETLAGGLSGGRVKCWSS